MGLMRIIVLHGDNILKARLRLQKFVETAKTRGWKVERIDSEAKLSLPEVLTNQTIFPSERLFIVEGTATLKKSDLNWLKGNHQSYKGNLVIYQEGLIPQTFFRQIPEPEKVEEFKLPRRIFEFLQSFFPGNGERCLEILHSLDKNEAPELVFALLCRHLRDLYWVRVDSLSIAYPAWRVSKLTKQAKLFSSWHLKKMIAALSDIDVSLKSGRGQVLASLDLFILTSLQSRYE